MRKIKFRAWDMIKNKMYDTAGISPHNEIMVSEKTNSGRRWLLVEDIHIADYQQYGHDDVILMQFTGLKDMNGKEIYEGDICKMEWEGHQIIAPMVFDEERAQFGLDATVMFEAPDHLSDVTIRPEIIGNIYQNPDLLK